MNLIFVVEAFVGRGPSLGYGYIHRDVKVEPE